MKKRVEHIVWYQMLPYLKEGVVIFFTYVISTLSLELQLTIKYLAMAIRTKTNSIALSYLTIITNKTVEMIAMKNL